MSTSAKQPPFSVKKVKRIGFVVKHHQIEGAMLALDLAQMLKNRGFEIFFCDESLKLLNKTRPNSAKDLGYQIIKKSEMPSKVQFLIVLGGDGTYLSAARLMKVKSIPILGVNLGTLGFLTEVKKDEIYDVLNRIFHRGEIQISERTLLTVKVIRNGKKILEGLVVNDAVISKGAIARIIGIQISVDGSWASTLRADGVIVSTPTGSTAYSLAAGGPIVSPKLECVLITPICAHGLTQRTLIMEDHGTIEMKVEHMPGHVYLTLDGQQGIDLKLGDRVQVSRFKKHKLQLVAAPNRDYFMLLREKLRFG